MELLIKTKGNLPIETWEDHEAALARLDELMDAEEGSIEGHELAVLAEMIEAYESRTFSTEKPTFLDAIKFRMEQAGYTQSDLAKVLESKSRASEIMNGSIKHLTRSQIKRLRNAWGISADVLINDVIEQQEEKYACAAPATVFRV